MLERVYYQTLSAEAAVTVAEQDRLYLHPESVAVQREYETRATTNLLARFTKANTPRKRNALINDLVGSGLGKPSNLLSPLLRLSFDQPRQQLLGSLSLFDTLQQLEKDLTSPPISYVSVDRNWFTKAIHIDFLYRKATATSSDVARIYVRLQRWLIRTLEAAALGRLRNFVPRETRARKESFKELRRRFVESRIAAESQTMLNIFASLIKYLLPENRKGVISEFLPQNRLSQPIHMRLKNIDGQEFDDILPALQLEIDENPRQLSNDRLQELRALYTVVKQSKAPFTITCAEKFLIVDQFGNQKDEWDGTMIEIADDRIMLTVVEAKNLTPKSRNANEAFKQLKDTRDLIRSRHKIQFARRRLSGIGAAIQFTIFV